ncbi:hypothetical protein [Pseudomonas sp. NPDC088444]|uniref:hypothetical protein n=1 Tax=Pseudomonas sp. NPDC088444 TaxID=3364456 RepID=UPI00384D97EF
MKKAYGLLAMLCAGLVLAGCGEEKSKQECSNEGEAFFTQSLDSYFVKHPQAIENGSYTLRPGARYDSNNNWWVVPFDYSDKKAQALLSCDGHLEITLR